MAPKVHAKPHKAMVRQTITLKGAGFAPSSTVRIAECSKEFWLAPTQPCLEEDAKEVVTNTKGKFETPFEVGVCPEAERTKRPTQVVCYVGVLRFGEDTGELVGGARVLVSYP